jgi:hypothetical protein
MAIYFSNASIVTFHTCLFIVFSAGEPYREFISENLRRTKARWWCGIETKHTHANKQTYNQFQLASSESARGALIVERIGARAHRRLLSVVSAFSARLCENAIF